MSATNCATALASPFLVNLESEGLNASDFKAKLMPNTKYCASKSSKPVTTTPLDPAAFNCCAAFSTSLSKAPTLFTETFEPVTALYNFTKANF